MKKVLLIFALFMTCYVSAQKVGVDVIKFQGNVTSTIRDTYDVPAGEYWLIYNTTTTQLEVSDDTDSWAAFSGISDGDKGDITVSGSGGTWNIDSGAVGSAEIANGAIQGTDVASNTIAGSNILNATIEGQDLATNTIEEQNLEVTNAPTDNYILSFDVTSGGFTWVEAASGSGDFLADGSIPMTGNLNMDGNDVLNTDLVEAQNAFTANTLEFRFFGGDGLSAGLVPIGGTNPSLLYSWTTSSWNYPILDTADNFSVNTVEAALAELAAGAGDTNLSTNDQPIATGVARVVNTEGSGTLSFNQAGVEVARVGNDNDDVFQVLALEALSGNVIFYNSGVGLKELDTGTTPAADYAGSLVVDAGVIYFSSGTDWISLMDASGTITDTGGYYTTTTVEGALQENGATDVAQGASISQNGSDIADIQTALSVVPSSQMGSVTYTANQSSIASHAIDSLIVVLDYNDETYTIESGIFSHGQSIRIKNGTSGIANVVAGTGVTFPSTSLYREGQAITIRRLTTATGPEIWGIDDGVPSAQIFVHEEALSDYTTDLSTGTSLAYWRTPAAIEILEVRSSLIDPSSSGLVTVDINASGATMMATNKLTIDATEKTSLTAATAAGLTTTTFADDIEITYDIDAAGTDAKGLKVKIYYVKL